MHSAILKFFLLAMCLTTGPMLTADAFPIEKGRVASSCPVLELFLTARQSEQVEHNYKSGMQIRLTKGQIAFLRKQAKLPIPPTKIKIYKAEELKGSCTCGLANFALPFKTGWLELPIGYLCSDGEAKSREIID